MTGLRRRRWWRPWPAKVAWGVLAVLTLYVGVTFVQVWMASNRDSHPSVDAIVVLGAAQYNGRPSPVLQARLRHGLELYRQHVAPVIVVTGGRQAGDNYTEATTGYNWLRAHGVPDSAIRQEVKGHNTYESLAAVAGFGKGQGMHTVVLVSDNYHAARLAAIARETGLSPHVSPAGRSLLSTLGEWKALAKETLKVSAGRIIGYRRLSNLTGTR